MAESCPSVLDGFHGLIVAHHEAPASVPGVHGEVHRCGATTQLYTVKTLYINSIKTVLRIDGAENCLLLLCV